MARYIVLGNTALLRSGRRLLGRYKEPVELRDVYEVEELRRAARRGGLLVFAVDHSPRAWFLVTFDIPSGGRRATKEYSVIKEAMYWSLCGRVDNSTYACPVDTRGVPARYTDRVSAWTVRPASARTREAMRRAVEEAVEWIRASLARQAERLHGRGVARAEALLASVSLLAGSKAREKARELLGYDPLEAIQPAAAALREALSAYYRRGRQGMTRGRG